MWAIFTFADSGLQIRGVVVLKSKAHDVSDLTVERGIGQSLKWDLLCRSPKGGQGRRWSHWAGAQGYDPKGEKEDPRDHGWGKWQAVGEIVSVRWHIWYWTWHVFVLSRDQTQLKALTTKIIKKIERTLCKFGPVSIHWIPIIRVWVCADSCREHLNIVFIGHVDAGKSTIGGQILYLTVRNVIVAFTFGIGDEFPECILDATLKMQQESRENLDVWWFLRSVQMSRCSLWLRVCILGELSTVQRLVVVEAVLGRRWRSPRRSRYHALASSLSCSKPHSLWSFQVCWWWGPIVATVCWKHRWFSWSLCARVSWIRLTLWAMMNCSSGSPGVPEDFTGPDQLAVELPFHNPRYLFRSGVQNQFCCYSERMLFLVQFCHGSILGDTLIPWCTRYKCRKSYQSVSSSAIKIWFTIHNQHLPCDSIDVGRIVERHCMTLPRS